jgi:hypothetical protein
MPKNKTYHKLQVRLELHFVEWCNWPCLFSLLIVDDVYVNGKMDVEWSRCSD